MLLYFNLDNFIEILGQLDKGKQREAYYLGICSENFFYFYFYKSKLLNKYRTIS